MTSRKKTAPETLDELQSLITAQYDDMSKRLRLVGEYFVRYPNVVALENMASIAADVDVSPSTLVRFANYMGFKAFSDLQELYRGELKGQVNGYRERPHRTDGDGSSEEGAYQLMLAFSDSQALAMDEIDKTIPPELFEKTLERLEQAKTIYIAGVRRAFPVAYYFAYALMRVDMNVVLIDDVGALHKNQLKRSGEQDLLVAVSYQPHADETTESIKIANERQCPVILLTDHSYHPCKNRVTLALEVKEAEMMGMTALSCSMHLAQSLVMGITYRQEK